MARKLSTNELLQNNPMESLSQQELNQFINWLNTSGYTQDMFSEDLNTRYQQLAAIYNNDYYNSMSTSFPTFSGTPETLSIDFGKIGDITAANNISPFDETQGANYSHSVGQPYVMLGAQPDVKEFQTLSIPKDEVNYFPSDATPTAASDSGGGKPDDTTGGGEPSPVFITPDAVDENVYKALPEDLALALSPIDRAWTPANNFLNAASIVNPGAALAYGLTTVGGDVAQALLDKANIDVPITYDRATEERMLNRYADLLGADLTKENGKYGLKYSKAAAESAGLSQPTSGGTSRNAIRAYFELDPFETDVLVPDNLLDSVVESDIAEKKRIMQNLYPYTSESHSYRTSDYNNSSTGTGTASDDLLNQSKSGTSSYTAGTK